MSVDTKIHFPPGVPGDLICETFAILAGCTREFATPQTGIWGGVSGLEYVSSNGDGRFRGFPDAIRCVFPDPIIPDCARGFGLRNPGDLLGFSARLNSMALSIAAGRRMVKAFGGILIAEDVSDRETLVVAQSAAYFPEQDWHSRNADVLSFLNKKNDFLRDLPPLTVTELLAANDLAGNRMSPDEVTSDLYFWLRHAVQMEVKDLTDRVVSGASSRQSASI